MCVLVNERKENKTACCSSLTYLLKQKLQKLKRNDTIMRRRHMEKNEEKQKCLIKVWPQGSFIRYAYKYQEEFRTQKTF